MNELTPPLLAIVLVVLGLSYLLQTRRWLRLVRRFVAEPESLFPAAIVMVATGTMVGYGYDSWSGTWPIFVTVLGWLLALKGAIILIAPGLIQKLQGLSDRFLRIYMRLGGVLLATLGVLLWRSLGGV